METNTVQPTTLISIIICSQDDVLSHILLDNIDKTIGVDYEIIHIFNEKNKYSIFEAYNLGVQRAKGDILCFQHNDIEYLTSNWGYEVVSALSDASVGACAVAGANYMRKSPSYYPIGEDFNVINLVQATSSGRDEVWKSYSNKTNIVVFDGLWFCIKRECFDKIAFDTKTFSGFHFYDIDISTQLIVNGYTILALPNVLIKHYSGGFTNTSWLKNSFLYAKKWSEHLPISCREINSTLSYNIECSALYSSFRHIILSKLFYLLGSWCRFAKSITGKGPIRSLIIIYKHHKKAIK